MKCSTFLFLVILIPIVLSQDMFEIEMICPPEKQGICGQFEDEFLDAGDIIASNLMLNTKIEVEVHYESINEGSYAGTTPVLERHVGPDGVERLYPTALLKQLNIPVESEVDIKMSVNIDEEAAFWFRGDGPIQPNQIDFTELALHELIHGIGFTSTWELPEDTSFNTFLTPRLNDGENDDDPVTFDGFFETPFDSFLVHLGDGKRISDIAKSLNGFAPKGTEFPDLKALYDQLLQTQQQNAELMLTYATTGKSLGFIPNGSPDALVLNTDEVPFSFGSSINHFREDDYENTSDFLMVPTQGAGVTLQDKIKQTGSSPGGGIGPKLRSVLGTLGYTVNPNPPPMTVTSNKNNTQKDQKIIPRKIPRTFFRRKI